MNTVDKMDCFMSVNIFVVAPKLPSLQKLNLPDKNLWDWLPETKADAISTPGANLINIFKEKLPFLYENWTISILLTFFSLVQNNLA